MSNTNTTIVYNPDSPPGKRTATGHTQVVFTSLSAFIACADSSAERGFAECGAREQTTRFDQGTKTYQEATMLARRGWPEGARAIDRIMAGVAGAMSRISQGFTARVYRDVAPGKRSYLDPVSLLAESPDPWVCREDRGGGGGSRVVRLITNQAASASMSTSQMFARGAVVCAATALLDAANVRTEVWQGSQSSIFSRNDYRIQTRVCIKRADERLDYDTAAFMLAHPASQRRMVWAVREGFGFSPRVTAPSTLRLDPSDDMISVSDIVDGHYGGQWDMKQLMLHVRSITERVGVTFPDSFIETLKGLSIPESTVNGY